MSEETAKTMNPNSLAIQDAAQLLSKAGGQDIGEEVLRKDIQAGAPTNADGTLNLVQYAAWLIQELSRAD